MISGERDTEKLANLADFRCKQPKEIIAKSLNGNWDESLMFALKQSHALYHYVQDQITECERQIETLLEKYSIAISPDDTQTKEVLRSKKRVQKKKEIPFDIEQYGSTIFGVNLMLIPSIGSGTILKLTGELGHDFTDKFDSSKKFCKWLNTVPNNKISAGKILSSKLPKRKNRVGQILREAVNTLSTTHTPLGDYYRKMKSRKGPKGANVATANKLGKIIYTMVKTHTEYNEKMILVDEHEVLKRQLKCMQKKVAKIQEKIDACEVIPKSQSA
jgi:transposase